MDTIIYTIIYLLIGMYELFPLYRQRRWKQAMIYSIFYFGALLMSILLSLGVKIPSPAGPIEDAVQKVLGFF